MNTPGGIFIKTQKMDLSLLNFESDFNRCLGTKQNPDIVLWRRYIHSPSALVVGVIPSPTCNENVNS